MKRIFNKRLLSFLLALLMVLEMAPLSAVHVHAVDNTDLSIDFNYQSEFPDAESALLHEANEEFTSESITLQEAENLAWAQIYDGDLKREGGKFREYMESSDPEEKYIVLSQDVELRYGSGEWVPIKVTSDKVLDLNGFTLTWWDKTNKEDGENWQSTNIYDHYKDKVSSVTINTKKEGICMKKAICLALSAVLCICALCGCGAKAPKETEPKIIKTFELKDEKITAENVSPYEGKYLEYGDVETVSGIYAMKFTNTGNQTIQSAQLIFSDGTQELSFQFEMLPAGQSVIAAEQDQLAAAAEELNFVDSNITYLEAGLEKADCVKVTDNSDGTVKIENVTDEMLPLVRVFFRPADANGNPIGGPCKSLMGDGIEAGAAVDVAAEGWDETCVVVTVLVINE